MGKRKEKRQADRKEKKATKAKNKLNKITAKRAAKLEKAKHKGQGLKALGDSASNLAGQFAGQNPSGADDAKNAIQQAAASNGLGTNVGGSSSGASDLTGASSFLKERDGIGDDAAAGIENKNLMIGGGIALVVIGVVLFAGKKGKKKR